MQRTGIIININNGQSSPTKAPIPPLGATEAIPHIIRGIRNEPASKKRRSNEP